MTVSPTSGERERPAVLAISPPHPPRVKGTEGRKRSCQAARRDRTERAATFRIAVDAFLEGNSRWESTFSAIPAGRAKAKSPASAIFRQLTRMAAVRPIAVTPARPCGTEKQTCVHDQEGQRAQPH
jgi:hypothetical protein